MPGLLLPGLYCTARDSGSPMSPCRFDSHSAWGAPSPRSWGGAVASSPPSSGTPHWPCTRLFSDDVIFSFFFPSSFCIVDTSAGGRCGRGRGSPQSPAQGPPVSPSAEAVESAALPAAVRTRALPGTARGQPAAYPTLLTSGSERSRAPSQGGQHPAPHTSIPWTQMGMVPPVGQRGSSPETHLNPSGICWVL